MEGLEHIEAARAEGRGVLLLSAHFTTVELACRLLIEVIQPPARMLVRRHGWAPLEALVDVGRRAHAATRWKKGHWWPASRTKAGEAVLWRRPGLQLAERVRPFFGVPRRHWPPRRASPNARNAVTLPHGRGVMPTGRYRLTIGAPWPDWPSGDAEADAARYMAELEAAAARRPRSTSGCTGASRHGLG